MKLIEIAVSVLAAFAVLAFGAVDPVSVFILQIGSGALLLVWFLQAVRQRQVAIGANRLFLPLLGFCGVALAQYVLGRTAYAYATKAELLNLGAYLFLSFLWVQAVGGERERKAVVCFLITLGFLVSLFGIVQFFTWTGKLYWSRAVANSSMPFGPFVDRDHFAGFVELTVPFAFALVFNGAVRRDLMPLVSLFAILPAGAAVLSASRGGILSLFFGLVVLGVLSGRRVTERKNLSRIVLLVVLSGVVIAWLGMEGISRRFRDLAASGISQDRRVTMFNDTWRIFLDHPWLGTGLGTLEFVYPRYESRYDGSIVDHTHNDYLEILADTGIAGGLCAFFFILFLFRQGFSNLRQATTPFGSAFYSGALSACTSFLLHSLVDFNLHIPSNALLFFLIAFAAGAPQVKAVKTTLLTPPRS